MIEKFLKQELTGWHAWEVIYLLSVVTSIGVIAGYLGDTALGIASAVTGTLYTMLAGKGKVSCYIFGIFNTIAYGYIARSQKIYGDMMLNWGIYLPMMFAGFAMWFFRRDRDYCIIKERLSFRALVVFILSALAAIAVYAFLLRRMGGSQPYLDAFTTVVSVMAMVLTLKRCIEQWICWTLVNLASVIMWIKVCISTGGESVATLLWWLIMLASGVIFFVQWLKSLKNNPNVGNGEC